MQLCVILYVTNDIVGFVTWSPFALTLISTKVNFLQFQISKHLAIQGWRWGVIGSHEVAGYSKAHQFSRRNGPQGGLIVIKLQYHQIQLTPWPIAATNQLCSDFQQGGCLYKPTSGIQWTPEHSQMSGRPQKQASAKADPSTFGSGVLVISQCIDGVID